MLRWLARLYLKLGGWTLVGRVPDHIQRAVVIAAPHTSNWDAWYGLLFCVVRRMPIRFAIKKEAMVFPLSLLLHRLGAVPIQRTRRVGEPQRQSAVETMKEIVESASGRIFLVIAPEGTRQYAPRWKRGFYHIAVQTQVPILLGYIDYSRKRMGIGPLLQPTGDAESDIKAIKSFYEDKMGKYPAQGVRPAQENASE